MGAQITIAGFSSSDKVPGFYGETKTGQGASSIQSVPMVALVVGISGPTGAAAQNTQIVPLQTTFDCDNNFVSGWQAARMGYVALRSAGVILFGLGIPAATGATAAKAIVNIAGTWSTIGTLGYRINGERRSITVGPTDTVQVVAANLAADINNQFRWPVTATAAQLGATATWQVTLTHKTPGLGGNKQIIFLDTTLGPSGFVASLISSDLFGQLNWKATSAYGLGSFATPTIANGFFFQATAAGTSGASEPTWPLTVGGTVVDATVTWTNMGAILTGGGIAFYSGNGTESVTTALNTIVSTQFDRIAIGHNDATNAALWKTQVDAQAGPIGNIVQQVCIGSNDAAATAQALAATTLNDTRFQVLRELNCETHPSEIAASMAALRSTLEGANWVQSYDDVVLPGVAPQSQKADWPTHATLVSDLNNGVTPLYNGQSGAAALVVRSIVTHCLNGASPDYSTLDTSDMTVPDQVRQDLRLYWTTKFKPNNPVVADDPPPGSPSALSGVATPTGWNTEVYSKLKSYERGTGFPSTQIIDVDQNLPQTGFDPVARRLMSAVNVVPAPIDHQIGVSVRGMQPS